MRYGGEVEARGALTCTCPVHANGGVDSAARVRQLGRALALEYLTVAWNVVEGVVAVWAALAAGSIALLGFGIDSFVETSSGLILVWRLRTEARHSDALDLEALDRRAHRFVGVSLLLLAAYVAWDASHALWMRERPEPTLIGLAITGLSLPVMVWLGAAKRRAARALDSHALESDAFQTTACMWLSVITLVGIGTNAALGWWWADPVAALAMTVFLAKEGLEAWRGHDCGCG
jgi:divalent metal cation (Fe/Co/Zn/Cd) transporter